MVEEKEHNFRATVNKALDKIEKAGTPKHIEKGTVFVDVGDIPQFFCIVKKGIVATIRYTEDGNEVNYWRSNKHIEDRTIGIPSILTDSPYGVSVKAMTDVDIIVVKKEKLFEMMQEQNDIAIAIAMLISSKFITTNSFLHKQTELNAEQKIFELLYDLASDTERENTEIVGNDIIVHTVFNQLEMAKILKIDRTTIYRSVKKMEKLGIMTFVDGKYIIHDLKELKKFC